MKRVWVLVIAAAIVAGATGIVAADEPAPPPATSEPAETPPPAPAPTRPVLRTSPREIVVEIPGERSRTNKLALIGVTAASALAGGLGVYFHLDSRDASDAVSAQLFTGRAWTADDEALVDRADRSRTRAAIFYGIGGALLTGAIVAYIVTDPEPTREVIRPTAGIAPTDGGAIAGAAWRF